MLDARIMVPGGGGVCKEVVESRFAFADYNMATLSADSRGSPLRKTGTGSTWTNDVHELLECPVCVNLMYPPIYQCPNGYTVCSNCKTRVHNCCPTCRNEMGNIRCLALEKVAESLELPCRYQILGCHDIFPYYSMLKHEKTAGFAHIFARMLELNVLSPVIFRFLSRISRMTTRFSIVSDNNFACTSSQFTLEWHQLTWPSCSSWAMKTRQGNLVTVWKLVAVAESLCGKGCPEAFAIVIEKFEIVKTDLSFNGTCHSSSQVVIDKN
ncbi:hypothetical protein V6N13_061734 [Hibiscus sabdariffa]|uniref:RING-type domain-containing protein n=1 Tax=Hibiscus sabdariffa TaxID=183260 RepID=A0ABR2BFQ6_9ROSI